MTGNGKVALALVVLGCLVSSLHAEVASQPILARPVVLKPGQARTSPAVKCSPSQPAILYIKGRIPADKEGKGGHVLSIKLNGKLLTPKNVTILNNKTKVYRLIPLGESRNKKQDIWGMDVFAPQKGWYFMKDSDYKPTFDDDFVCCSRTFLSNYYEHLLLVPAKLLGANNRIVLRNTDGRQSIEVARAAIYQGENDVIPFARNWMDPVFPWESPVEGDLLAGPVKVQACRGEIEPFTFSIYAMKDLKNVTVELGDLRGKANGKPLSRNQIDVYKVVTFHGDGPDFPRLFMPQIRWIPQRWQKHQPSIFKPIEGSVEVAANTNQRFFMDVHVPEDILPGEYRGVIKVRSGQIALADIPVSFRVLPFRLAKPRQRYWIWRAQWSPITNPDNIACLRDIKAHGFDGQIGNAGFHFSFKAVDGKIEVDDTLFRKGAQALRNAGLVTESADKSPDEDSFGVALDIVGIKGIDDYHEAIGDIMQKSDAELTPGEKELKKKLPAVRGLMLAAFREIKRITDEGGFKYYVLPVDEPDGKFWRQEWTRFIAGIAHEAGLKVWSTRNAFDWKSGIDESCLGIIINDAYKIINKGIVKGTFKGELAMPALPYLGRSRQSGGYGRRGKLIPRGNHFRGLIDEVRIYNRPLSDDEILRQYKSPATAGLLASYDFDEKGVVVKDRSGNGHDARLLNGAAIVPGRKGSAVKFDGIDDFVDTPSVKADLSQGWTISLWMKGTGNAFGRGSNFYYGRGNTRVTVRKGRDNKLASARTSTEYFPSIEQAWEHYTVSFDNVKKVWKTYVYDADKMRYLEKKVDWVYVQNRSFPGFGERFNAGILSWYYTGIGNITIFCYDWNEYKLFMVYPKDRQRFGKDGKPPVWYPTVGWQATREGVDDARYLNTLFQILTRKYGSEKKARAKIRELLSPVTGPSYENIGAVTGKLGGFAAMRKLVVKAIEANRK